jgi:hypothetical protein
MTAFGNRSMAEVKANLARYENMIVERRAQGLDTYIVPDRALGWRMQPGVRHPRWPYSTNSDGNRSSWPESFGEGDAVREVAIFGNSHVHGDESPDDETWVYQTQVRLGPDWRIHNLGVSAFATDQAVLRFQEFASQRRLDMAVLAITTTEIYRNLNQCRAFIAEDREIPLFKPRFTLAGRKLRLHELPTLGGRPLEAELDDPLVRRELRRNDAFYPRLTTQAIDVARRLHVPLPDIYRRLFPKALEMTIALCRHFLHLCNEHGVRPAIMILPVFWGGFPAGREFDAIARAFAGEVPLFDARDAFTPERLNNPREVLHHRANHYTGLSGGWVADHIAEGLRAAMESHRGGC